VEASPNDQRTVYVSHSGYKDNDFLPHVHRSTNGGKSWEDLSTDLPPLAVNDLLIVPGYDDQLLFAATDGGVYASLDAGETWDRLGSNLPMIAVYDMVYNAAREELVIGTFGKGTLSYDLRPLLDELLTTSVISQIQPLAWQIELIQNPVRDRLSWRIEGDIPLLDYRIVSSNGLIVQRWSDGEATGEKSLETLPAGYYVLQVNDGQQLRSQAFVKL